MFQRAIEIVKERLPEDVIILIMSHTGSRAFGWGSERMDIDIRGVFYTTKPYWDWVHIGLEGYDITMISLEHLKYDIYYRHWTVFENLSKPFLIHPAFDFNGFMRLCKADCIKYHMPSIKSEILRFKHVHKSPRAGLHCYRQLMVPIYFLDTGRIEIDCTKLNREVFHCKQFDLMVDSYKYGKKVKIDWDEAVKDYDRLLGELEDRLRGRGDRLNDKELNALITKILNNLSTS